MKSIFIVQYYAIHKNDENKEEKEDTSAENK